MLDDIHIWKTPVIIDLAGERHAIQSLAQASRVLHLGWPVERTAKHEFAVEACKAAMKGANPEVAYMAFVDATIEAGVFVE